VGRLRLGLLALRARAVRDWRALDDVSAEDWLEGPGRGRGLPPRLGAAPPRQVSAPTPRASPPCGSGASSSSAGEPLGAAVGADQPHCTSRGFAALADGVADAVRQAGGAIRLGAEGDGPRVGHGAVTAVRCAEARTADADAVVVTAALPVVARSSWPPHARRVRPTPSGASTIWATSACPRPRPQPVLDLLAQRERTRDSRCRGDRHTNLDTPDAYGGPARRLPVPLHATRRSAVPDADDAWLDFALPHLRRMFHGSSTAWGPQPPVWRAPYASPSSVCGYGGLVPAVRHPAGAPVPLHDGQIYPRTAGTNYAIRDGRATATHAPRGPPGGPTVGPRRDLVSPRRAGRCWDRAGGWIVAVRLHHPREPLERGHHNLRRHRPRDARPAAPVYRSLGPQAPTAVPLRLRAAQWALGDGQRRSCTSPVCPWPRRLASTWRPASRGPRRRLGRHRLGAAVGGTFLAAKPAQPPRRS